MSQPLFWTLVSENGLDYAPPPDAETQQRLCYPSFAARADDGTYLIADEQGQSKQVPFRFECRTIRVDADGNIIFDTWAHGIEDGYGCLLDDGGVAVLRRTRWELWIFSPQGAVIDRLALASVSKRMPRSVSWTCHGTFLIVFLNRVGDLDVVEIDRQGRLLWYLPQNCIPFGIAASVQALPSGNLLVADSMRHVAMEIDRNGFVVWQFGERKNPSSLPSHLSSPSCARGLSGGGRLIADTRNHRVLAVSLDGTAEDISPQTESLIDPTYADELKNKNYLICDTGNARVIELDRQRQIVWSYGSPLARRRFLSYPRAVEVTGSGGYLIADTAHDRIVEVNHGRFQKRPFLGEPALFWPRCVRTLPQGELLIADARNRRIVQVSVEGHIVNELRHLDVDRRRALEDPHDVRMLANGHLLVTDSPQGVVAEVDWSGAVHRLIGENATVELDDPHSAQQLEDGRIIISDTGNHRILVLDHDGRCVQEIEAIDAESHCLRLHQPRYAEVIQDGTMVIADTGHNRVLAATMDGRLIWELSCITHACLPRLNQPRWAKLINRWEVVICDHFHHRVLHLQCEGEGVGTEAEDTGKPWNGE